MVNNQQPLYFNLGGFRIDESFYYFDLRKQICKNLQNRQNEDEQSSFNKFQEYKLSPTREDCDGSGEGKQGNLWLIREVYRNLWNWKDISRKEKDNIPKEDINVSRYATSIFDNVMEMGPDAMNSYWTPLLGYMVYIMKEKQGNDFDTIDFYIHFGYFLNNRPPYYSTYLTLEQKNKINKLISDKFYMYKEQIKKEGLEDAFYNVAQKAKDYIDYKEQIRNNSEDLDKSRYEWILNSKLLDGSKELQRYGNCCYTIGNMVLVPAGFNNRRTLSTKDYWDKSLEILYAKGFNNTNHNVFFETSKYTKYINTFYLWEYVNQKELYKPLSLFKDDEFEDENRENIELFYKSVNKKIIRRGLFMIAMLRIALGINADDPKCECCTINETDWEVSKVYKEITKKVFLTNDLYSGYGEVIKKIELSVKNSEYEEAVNIILGDLKEKLDIKEDGK